MQVGDLVWARWQENCFGIIIGQTFSEVHNEYLYRVKWWWTDYNRLGESLEYEEDLVSKEEKCK